MRSRFTNVPFVLPRSVRAPEVAQPEDVAVPVELRVLGGDRLGGKGEVEGGVAADAEGQGPELDHGNPVLRMHHANQRPHSRLFGRPGHGEAVYDSVRR